MIKTTGMLAINSGKILRIPRISILVHTVLMTRPPGTAHPVSVSLKVKTFG